MNKNCLLCNKKFKVKPSHYERRKYCSYGCRNTAYKGISFSISTQFLKGRKNPNNHTIAIKCKTCRGEFKVSPSKVKNDRTKFCSKYCMNINKREVMKGEENTSWKGGVTPINAAIRGSAAYKEWRITVFRRDNYTCQICKIRGGILQADHVKPFSLYPSLRLDISNGRTLCVECHRATETWGNTRVYFKGRNNNASSL